MKKHIKTLLASFVLIFSIFMNAEATVMPRPIGGENRIKIINYVPNAVFRYVGHYYYQTIIEFSLEEEIQTITMGTPTPWQIIPAGNRIFLKPIESDATTNMTVITNKRMYFFEMHAQHATSINDQDLAFIVKFVYPSDNYSTIQHVSNSGGPDLTKPEIYNFNYKISGNAKNIEPVQIFDDGRFTYFKFRELNTEIPAIFLVHSDGTEGIINYRVEKGYIVVERVAQKYTLRHGNDVICVFNENPVL
ncbi:Type IV secretion system protein VirB9 [Candidatus Bandiella woodruffii]|uniref:Type IV secretion system protein VirB9 n=2 Tax=Candidatus Bandiella euplotis TaxID=1664265 RepID=A0ABZ0ULS0_9RICK|nr:Type IV secretion system protein VirB9 [Candidatus Bandiella woodruffii]